MALIVQKFGGTSVADVDRIRHVAGILGALLGQGLPPFDAAVLGVFVHGAAGDRVAARQGEVGLLAGDLLAELPSTLAGLQAAREASSPRRRPRADG